MIESFFRLVRGFIRYFVPNHIVSIRLERHKQSLGLRQLLDLGYNGDKPRSDDFIFWCWFPCKVIIVDKFRSDMASGT
jgi:hypothetical protein